VTSYPLSLTASIVASFLVMSPSFVQVGSASDDAVVRNVQNSPQATDDAPTLDDAVDFIVRKVRASHQVFLFDDEVPVKFEHFN